MTTEADRQRQAEANMGEYSMSKADAYDYIERARRGQPVDAMTLHRATLAYRRKEPRKLFIPVLSAAERMRVNAILLWNIGQARYHQLKESYAHPSKDGAVPVCAPDKGSG